MEPDTRKKIEETVMEILKTADLTSMTEFKVRSTVSELLGMDLTGIQHKVLVRSTIESFLLSNDADKNQGEEKDTCLGIREETVEMVQEEPGIKPNGGKRIICELPNNRKVAVQVLGGKPFVSIKKYSKKAGKLVSTPPGISMPIEQWSSFKKCFPAIQEAIIKMESNLRSEHGGQQIRELSNSVSAFNPRRVPNENNCFDRKNIHSRHEHGSKHIAESSNRITGFNPQFRSTENNRFDGKIWHSRRECGGKHIGELSNRVTGYNPQFLPIENNRFDGNNCHSRPEHGGKHTGELSSRVTGFNPQFGLTENNHFDGKNSYSRPEHGGELSNRVTGVNPQFFPIENIRFDGKNYPSWVHQMEFFLNQSEIAYVLTDPCPSVTMSPTESVIEVGQMKDAEQKWVNDDYICRCNILNSLSDNLFHHYSKKCKSAKELWEELRLVYLYEEYGTKASQVKKYIEFQIEDGKQIVDQVQELNIILDSIIANGMFVDENFHVNGILSKLPPSWKDFCIKLLQEESLPFSMLMDCVIIEEQLRNGNSLGAHSNVKREREREMMNSSGYWKN